MAVIEALRIMEKGEELDDARVRPVDASQTQAVGADPGPMRQAVDAVPIEAEFVPQEMGSLDETEIIAR